MNRLVQRGLTAVVTLSPVLAFAAVDAEITGAITDAAADGLLYVGALAAAGASFMLIKKVLSKLGITF